MPRLPDNPGRDLSANASNDKFAADIAELFASEPPEVDDAFADSIVRMRIGNLIAQAMETPAKLRRH